MEVIHLSEQNHEATAKRVAWLLKCGGVAAVPTDTVYGLLADTLRFSSVEKVWRMKERSRTKAMPVFVRDFEMARQYAVVDEPAERILENLWPGPTTVVLRKKRAMPDVVTAGAKTIGLRIPDHPFLRRVLELFSNPVLGTSANISGNEPAQSAEEVLSTFRRHVPRPDLVIDSGVLPPSPPSTVLDLTNPSSPQILRLGAITKEKLGQWLSQWQKQ